MLFQAVSSYFQMLRSSSIKDFFHEGPLPSGQISLIVFSSNGVDLQLLESKLCYFPAISLLFRTGGRTGGRVDGRLEKSILRLTQPSLAGTWAELGNNAINYGLLSADRWRTHSTRTKIKVVFWLLKNLRESYIFLFIFHVHINVRSANDYFF
jgi:hypothetical protein